MNKSKFIVSVCRKKDHTIIDDIGYMSSISKHQIQDEILYDTNNFPLKIHEFEFYQYCVRRLHKEYGPNAYLRFLE